MYVNGGFFYISNFFSTSLDVVYYQYFRLGPKRASKIRKLFNLTKDDDVCQYVIKRPLPLKEVGIITHRRRKATAFCMRLDVNYCKTWSAFARKFAPITTHAPFSLNFKIVTAN